MRTPHRKPLASYRGVAMLVTLLFLALFASSAVAIAVSADIGMAISRNRRNAQQARTFAEAGLDLVRRHIGGITVPAVGSASEVQKAVADQLEAMLSASPMLNGGQIHYDSTHVTLPPITVDCLDGQTGTIEIEILASGGASDDTSITIASTGVFGNASQTAYYNMTVQRGQSILTQYGIASKSPVNIEGNAQVLGANNQDEASVMSATYSTAQAIVLKGSCSVAGDVAVCNPNGQIRKKGAVTVGGREILGAAEPEWPRVDTDLFEPFATNTYTGNGAGDLVLSNVRIPPNTNPTFSGNTTIFGVVYVEPPNTITFSGNTNLIGMIVCEPPAVENLTGHSIKFTGNMSTSGVENLPPGAQYDGLRELTGSFLLAPGYSAEFTGNFGAVNGCIVASEFRFSGNASGRVKGGVVNLRDSQFIIQGSSTIIIDKSGMPEQPAGLQTSLKLVCVSGSYREE